MHKTLLLLLLGASASCFGQIVAANKVDAYPRVVAKVSLTGQTAPISTTTLFTPKKNGLFRISAYAAMTTPDLGSATRWQLFFGWTDYAGVEGPEELLQGQAGSVPPTAFFGCTSNLGCPLVVEDLAGLPLTYSMGSYLGSSGGTYELSITVEQLM